MGGIAFSGSFCCKLPTGAQQQQQLQQQQLLLLLLLLLLFSVGCSSKPTAASQYEMMELITSNKQRRSASQIIVNSNAMEPKMLKLEFDGNRGSRLLEISKNNKDVLANSRSSPVTDNALHLLKVFDVHGNALRLPNDRLSPLEADEYKFLIRGHFNHKYVCMDRFGKVFNMLKEGYKLSEDCLWRGKFLANLHAHNNPKRKMRITLYHAFYPNSENQHFAPTKSKWYLGFGLYFNEPIKPKNINSGTGIIFQVLRYPSAFHSVAISSHHNGSFVIGSNRSVNVQQTSIEQLYHEHAKQKYNNTGCANAAKIISQHSSEQLNLNLDVKYLIKDLIRTVGDAADKAGINKAPLRKLIWKYFRRLAMQLITQRSRCNKKQLIIQLQSKKLAKFMMKKRQCKRKFNWLRKKNRRQFRRLKRKLLNYLSPLLKRKGRRRRKKHRNLLRIFRKNFNIQFPKASDIRRGIILRLYRRQQRKLLRKMGLSTVTIGKQLDELQFKDSANFLLLLKHKGRSILSHVSDKNLQELIHRWRGFPEFYRSLRCP